MPPPYLWEQLLPLAEALEVDAIGVVPAAEAVPPEVEQSYDAWLAAGHHAGMHYLAEHREVRRSPQQLLPEAQSMIVCAVSYYPPQLQEPSAPQIAKYAYGRDYHKVLRQLLGRLADEITEHIAPHTYRICIDTAPLHERYWAARSGIGHLGRNRNLISRKHGSYLFIATLLTSLAFTPTAPATTHCGHCTRCIDACPTGALSLTGLDARRCLSYLTIEHRGEIPASVATLVGERLYGCDTCQDVCPYNRKPTPTRHFPSLPHLLALRDHDLVPFTPERYAALCHGTALTRAKYDGMLRNVTLYLQAVKRRT